MVENGMLGLLASTDEQGMLEMDLSEMGFLRSELEQGDTPKAEWMRNCLDSALLWDCPLMECYLDAAKVNLNRIDLSITITDKEQLLRVNLAKLMHLPGNNTQKELLACKAFLEEFVPTMMADQTGRALLVVENNRNHNRKTYGELGFKATGLSEDEAVKMVDAALAKHGWAQQWLDNLAKDLNKLGPYSWSRITTEHLIGREAWMDTFGPKR